MKIGIDISQIAYSTGVSTYTKNLVRALLSIDKENEYILFAGSLRGYPKVFRIGKKLVESKYNASLKSYLVPPFLADIIWNRLHILNIEHFTGVLDVFHASDWTQPPSFACKVTTVHDLVPILYPKMSNPKTVAVHKRRLEHVKKECDRIIVPTKTTFNDLLELGFDPNKIRYIPEACGPDFKKMDKSEIDSVKKKYHIRGSYILSVGTDPRKNIDRIINAYIKVKPKLGTKLVIVGSHEKEKEEARGIVYTGRILKNDLIALYSGAQMLLYPSLYEGFGLPILEAFSVGTPVITSNFGSMKEIGGKGACFVDPENVDDISKAILEVYKKASIHIRRGKKEANKYSWQKTAQETLKLYKEITC